MSEFILQIEKLLGAYADPEYRFLALEPLISYGLLAGFGMLVTAFFIKAPRLQVAALVVIGVAALAYFPYRDARLIAQPRLEIVYKSGLPARASDFAANTQAWLADAWQFRLLVLCAFAALLIGIQRNRIGFGLGILTALLSFVAMKNALWHNYQDALAYHPNLKKHEVPIDQREPASRVPLRESAPRDAVRAPAPAVTQPAAPAGLAPAPRYPDPNQSFRAGAPAPTPAPSAPAKSRKVQPLPRF